MRIWIVNYYTSPDCSNPRYLEFAKHFMAAGHEVLTFYGNWKLEADAPLFERQNVNGLDFVRVKAPYYVGNGVARMKSLYGFSKTLKKYCLEFEKPDVVLHNIHPPFDYPIINMAKKIGAKYIAEAWDLWPEFFVTLGLVGRNNPAMKIAYAIEKQYYYSADEIVFTFLGAFDYLKRQRWMKEQGGKINPSHLHYINNGIDLEEFDKNKLTFTRPDYDINNTKIKKIVYLGSINRANNVKTLIDAAALMQDVQDVRFFIYGDGAYRTELEQYVKDFCVNNVVFKEKRIPLEECAWVVSQATVNVMNYEKGFGRFGVSSGKMFQYLAAGKPIVCNVDIAYDNVIADNNLGVAHDIDTPEEFAEAIRKLAEQPQEEFDAMCARVREVAKRFDYKVLAAEEIKVIESAVRTS